MGIIEANPSITHTFGNVSCIAMEYVKSYFEKDFFKTEHVSTKMAHRQLNVFRSKKEFWKNKKPMLIMRPRIDMDDSSTFLYGSTMKSRVTNNKLGVDFTNTIRMIKDKENGVMIRYNWDRYKIIFDFAVVVETYNQQLNIVHQLKNQMVPNYPYIIKSPLEAYIPKTIMNPAIHHLGLQETDTAEVLKYMNTSAATPVTYKYKNGSGNNEYFMMYDTNIETIISDIDHDDGESKNMIQNTFTISFSLSMEFYTVGNWYLFLQNADQNFLTAPPDAEIPDDGHMIPIYSIPLRYDLHLDPGWIIFNAPMCFVSDEYMSKGYDETDLSEIITPSLHQVIKHQIGMNVPIDSLIRFRCFKNNTELPYGPKGYMVDADTLSLKIYDCDPKLTYRLFILTNNFLINSMAAEITKFNQET